MYIENSHLKYIENVTFGKHFLIIARNKIIGNLQFPAQNTYIHKKLYT